MRFAHHFACAALLLLIGAARADTLVDARGHVLAFEQPARRVVSLAPFITELLFAAGAGDKVVGVSRFSDYPPAARRLPIVGDSSRLDIERIIALHPDLVVAWRSGNPAPLIEKLERLGVRVWVVEPRRLDDIAHALRDLGRLAGTEPTARLAADDFAGRAHALRMRYARQRPVSVFFEIDHYPLLTLNGDHLVNDVLQLCGGRNVFATAAPLVPRVGLEDVIHADPEAILIATNRGDEVVGEWQQQRELRAVEEAHVYRVPPDLILRQSLRILDGAALICRDLEQVREGR